MRLDEDGQGEKLGREVTLDVAQNLADYLAWLDRMINYEKMLNMLKSQQGNQ